MEYTLTKLEPGGKYHVVVQLGNMSKEASVKVTTGEQGGVRPTCTESASAPGSVNMGQGSAVWWPGLYGSSLAIFFCILHLFLFPPC